MGNQRGVMSAGDGGDQKVVGADGLALGEQVGANLAVVFGGVVVEMQAGERGEEGAQRLQVGFAPLAALGAVEQFCLDDATEGDVDRVVLAEALDDCFVPLVE